MFLGGEKHATDFNFIFLLSRAGMGCNDDKRKRKTETEADPCGMTTKGQAKARLGFQLFGSPVTAQLFSSQGLNFVVFLLCERIC